MALGVIVLAAAPGRTEDSGALPPIEQFHATVDRPLFEPSRHARPSPAGLAAANLSASSLRLTGLVKGDSGRTIALVMDGDRQTETRVGVGSDLNGWTVSAIDGRGMDLTAGRRRTRVLLKQLVPPPGK
jgi:hypothetical protein